MSSTLCCSPGHGIWHYNFALEFGIVCRQEVNGSDTNVDLTERARAAVYAGPPRRTIGNDDAIFDHDDPKIKEVILKI